MSSTAPPSGSEPASVDSTASAEVVALVPPTDLSPSIGQGASGSDRLADEAVSDVVSDAKEEVQRDKQTSTSTSSTEGLEQPSPKLRQERKRSRNAGRITHREEREKHHQSASSSSRSFSSKGKTPLGESAGVALLLSNHALFGLAERVCYHFDLIETLRRSGEDVDNDKVEDGRGGSGNEVKEGGARRGGRVASTASQQNQTFVTSAGNSFCGVSSLLECVPLIPPNKQTKKLRRLLRNRVKEFNLEARLFRSACSSGSSGTTGPRCYQPPSLPLRPKPTTRVAFAYEMTSLVICLDASSTVTSTFGNLGISATNSSSFGIGDDGAICALDRLGGMVRRYLTALVEPVPAASAINSRGGGTGRNRGNTTANSAGSNTGSTSSWWMPELRVTVLATFPKASSYVLEKSGSELGRTSLLVRDYRVTDLQSAEELASAVEDWAVSKVEGIIASRLSQAGGRSNDRVDSMSSSSLRDLLEICDDALASTLPPEGRPAVVLATDCRSVDCQSVLETLGNTRRTDVPIHVLDLSSSHSHSVSGVTRSMDKGNRPSAPDQLPIMQHSITNDYLIFDDTSPETFPLGMSDDAEALYDVCRATGGCFIDSLLLEEASRITAGHVPSDSVFHGDHYLSFRRRALRPNALQWYTIFCLSPLTPLYNSSWGRLPPPAFLRRGKSTSPNDQSPLLNSLSPSSTLLRQQNQFVRRGAQARTVFSVYAISPVRVKSILIMRLIEGFRARKYGLNTRDEDKVSVHLTVPLEFGIVVHYEFSYVASPFYNVLVGSAHVKIELSGDPGFIQSVKNDFINHQVGQMRDQGTISQRISAQLCKFLRYVRKEDAFDSYLTPREWNVQLQPGSNFLRRLGIMSSVQRHRHFDVDSSIEVVCVGGDPFSNQESLLSEFIQEENGENELFEAIEQFSTQTIIERDCYIKQLPSSRRDLVMYCLISVKRSSEAARLFSVTLEFFGCQDERERIGIVQELKDRLRSCATSLVLLPRRVSRYLHMLKQRKAGNVERSQSFLHRAHWTLMKDDDLIAVICQRRRSSIGNFMLLDSSTTHALLGKFVSSKTLVQGRERSFLNLVLYHIRTSSTKDHVSVDIYMETERGFLNPFNFSPRSPTKPMFYEFFERLKRRDEECSLGLRSRRRLLSVFGSPNEIRLRTSSGSATGEVEELFAMSAEEQEEDLCRLLVYANTSTKHLRFFKDGSGVANDALATFTAESILSSTLSGSTDIAELKIDPTKTIGTCKEGRWFLIRHDNHTLSFLHFALSNESLGPDEGIGAGAQMIRQLTFHTVYSADLYQTKDDFDGGDEEEDCEEEHAEHLGVTEFAERIERNHSRNYASALYLALRTKGEDTATSTVGKIDSSDFEFATRSCLDEVKVTDVYVTAASSLDGDEKAVPSDDSSLPALILSMFEPVPVDNGSQYFYYKGDETFDDEQIFDYHPSGQDRIHDLTVPYSGIMSDGGDDSASLSSPVKNDDDVMSFSSEEGNEDEQIGFIGDLARSTSVDTSHGDSSFSSVDPPILVRFLLDGREASVKELTEMHSSSTLSVLMTVFREATVGTRGMPGHQLISEPSYRLPRFHAAVALKTASELKSFVAEQQLERLRHIGPQISEIDLRSALYQLSLLESNRVASNQVLLEFFVPGNDELVSASAPTGNEKTLESFFTLLSSEIRKQTVVKLKIITEGDFLVVSEGDSALPFWCFIQLQKGLGRILINVHHSDGFDRATEIAARTTAAIKQVCRRVNQILLLESLHRTRNASYMLIKEDDDGKTGATARKNTDEEGEEDLHRHDDHSHHPRRHLQGKFACTVKFQRSFFLFHRCSRKTAVMALESKVLHNFAVSNRRGLFVYKDEVDHVFYMRLSSFINADGSEGILLLVHGAEMPGPSITTELCRLLERMLFSISLEALSSVLTKNPFYPLLPVDIAFVRDFQSQWTAITENDESILSAPHDNERTYEFPNGVDPMLVLMYFRQNICGSGFFHHLNEADVEASDSDTDVSISTTDCDDKGGIVLPFDKSHFSLFYNNSPSQVDPHYQPVSTLTKRGDHYRKKSGTGIALVEIELLDGDGSRVKSIRTGNFAQLKNCGDRINYSSELLRMRRIFDESKKVISSPAVASRNYRVHIRIVNTLLDAKILQSWIELSLNQALVGFRIEAVLMESHRATSVSPNFNAAAAEEQSTRLQGWRRGPNPNAALICSTDVDSLCKGIPGLYSIISRSYDLPHPAVVKSELRKVPVKATLLAPLTLSLLEDGLMHDLPLERRGSCDDSRGGVVIIRTTPTDKARLVAIDRGASGGSIRVTEHNTDGRSRNLLFDRVTDSPEYIVAFGLGHSHEKEEDDGTDTKRRSSVLRSQLVFRELVVEDQSESSFAKRLDDLKSLRPDLFRRSLAFILHVTRSSRSLYVYNWNQASLLNVISRMEGIENEIIQSDQSLLQKQQAKYLRGLNIFNDPDEPGTETGSNIQSKKGAKLQVETNKLGGARPAASEHEHSLAKVQPKAPDPTPTPPRKIRRPTNILRPTLVGKSVEGSAMQALAASRARASSRTVPGQIRPQPVSTTGRQSTGTKSRKERQSISEAVSNKKATKLSAVKPTKKEATLLSARKDVVGESEENKIRVSTTHGGKALGPKRTQSVRQHQRAGSIPPKLAKDFFLVLKTKYCTAILKRRIPVSGAQQLAGMLMMQAQSQKRNFDELHYMSRHSIPLFSSSCDLFQCAEDQAMPFLSFIAKRIVETNRSASILSIENSPRPLTYVRQDLAGSRSCRAILFVQLAVARHSTTQQMIGKASGWLFICPPSVTAPRVKKRKKKGRSSTGRSPGKITKRPTKSLSKLEKTLSSLYSATACYRENLHMRSEFFNFIGTILMKLDPSGSLKTMASMPDSLQLLQTMIYEYPPFLQREHPRTNYRLLHDTLQVCNFSHADKPISFDAGHFFGYLCSNLPDGWGIVECSKSNQRLLMGDIVREDVPTARFFLVCSDSTGSTFEIFLLCPGDGGTLLDEYVVSPDQIYAERLQAKILRLACETINDSMIVSATSLRRDTLWANLSLEHNRDASGISSEDVREMCQLCSQTSLSDVDPRLSDLLDLNGDDHVGIRWQSVLFSMKQDPLVFSHCLAVQMPERNSTTHLFHFAKDDMFVCFELSTDTGKMLAAKLLLRVENKGDEASRKCKALELVTNWIVHFVWHNL